MHRANVSYTRNHLSELLARVMEGETITITDRQRPIAYLAPVTVADGEGSAWCDELIRRGLARRGEARLDLKALAALPMPVPRKGGDIVATLLDEREEGF